MFPAHAGVVNYLGTEVSTSRQKKFSLVMFVDTPGLVDGDMNYPFDVDNAIVLLGGCAIYRVHFVTTQLFCSAVLDNIKF